MILAFVGWLITVRKVSASTISQYLSGLCITHLKNGVLPPCLCPDVVQSILKGLEHEATKNNIPRLSVTITMMRLIKKKLTMSKIDLNKKRLLWAISWIALHGSFRIHELLAKEELSFDPSTTILGEDIRKLSTRIERKVEDLIVNAHTYL